MLECVQPGGNCSAGDILDELGKRYQNTDSSSGNERRYGDTIVDGFNAVNGIAPWEEVEHLSRLRRLQRRQK